jgi:hypothetical protein
MIQESPRKKCEHNIPGKSAQQGTFLVYHSWSVGVKIFHWTFVVEGDLARGAHVDHNLRLYLVERAVQIIELAYEVDLVDPEADRETFLVRQEEVLVFGVTTDPDHPVAGVFQQGVHDMAAGEAITAYNNVCFPSHLSWVF